MKASSEVLQRIKISAEDELLERISEHPHYQREIASILADDLATSDRTAENYSRRVATLLKTGTELSTTSYGSLFGLLSDARKSLKLEVSVRLFKSTEVAGAENAYIVSDAQHALIVFQSGILNTVSDADVLRSILGHELGHHGFGHGETTAADAVLWLAGQRPALEAIRGRRSRNDAGALELLRSDDFHDLHVMALLHGQLAELNADRAGLIAQPDLDPAVHAGMLMAAGAADSYGKYHAAEYLLQARRLIALTGGEGFDPADVCTTHPHAPLRALALEYFFSTDLFRELTGRGPGTERCAEFPSILPWIVPVAALKRPLSGASRVPKMPPAFVLPRGMDADPSRADGELTPASNPLLESMSDDGVDTASARPEHERERAELTCLLAMRIIGLDGNVTRGEEAFLMSVVRPRALAGQILAHLDTLDDDAITRRTVELMTRARDFHGRTKTTLIKMMIQAAKADRKISDDEIRAIHDAGDALGAAETAVRELRNVFGSRADTALAGPQAP